MPSIHVASAGAVQAAAVAAAQSAADAQTAMAAQFMTQDEGVATLITDDVAGPLTRDALQSREGWVNVREHGAIGDGAADDRAAFVAADSVAVAENKKVLVPAGTYNVSAPLGVTAPIEGAGAAVTTVRLTAAQPRLINMLGPARVSGLTIDGAGMASTEVVRLSEGGSLIDCTVTDTAHAAPYGVTTAGRDDNVTVEGCDLVGLSNGVRITDGSSNVVLRNNRITQWQQRGIWVASGDCDNVLIEGNRITDLALGGSSRYPIRVEGATSLHTNFIVRGNYVEGPHTSYHDTTTPGTGDQIALTHITGLLVEGNTSIGGGDVGITVSVECKNVRIVGNRIEEVDTCGIFAGAGAAAPGGTTVDNYTIVGNTILNAGRSRDGSRQDQYRVGVRMSDSRNMVVEGNVFANTDASNSMQYVASIKDAADLTIGANQATSMAKGIVMDAGGNTNISRVDASEPTTVSPATDPAYASPEVTARRKGGLVTLSVRFAVGTAVSGTTLASLPSAYRPTYPVRANVTTSGNLTAHVNITTSGTITPVWAGSPGGSPFQGVITFVQ